MNSYTYVVSQEVEQLQVELIVLSNLTERTLYIEHALSVGRISEEEAGILIAAMTNLDRELRDKASVVKTAPPPATYIEEISEEVLEEDIYEELAESECKNTIPMHIASEIHKFAWNAPRTTIIDPMWPVWGMEA